MMFLAEKTFASASLDGFCRFTAASRLSRVKNCFPLKKGAHGFKRSIKFYIAGQSRAAKNLLSPGSRCIGQGGA